MISLRKALKSSNMDMDKVILKSLYAQWKQVKDAAQKQCEQRRLVNVAESLRYCNMFRGDETLEELASLYKTTQGTEFCLRYHFPNLATLRLFKKDRPERFGIYIDAGNITIDEPKGKVLLIGRTTAVVNCSDLRNYEVVCLHQGRAIVNASGWSVVHVEAECGCSIVRNISENAVII